jgi:hypothetical protein
MNECCVYLTKYSQSIIRRRAALLNGNAYHLSVYSRRKITESLGNVTIRGKKDGRSKGEGRLPSVCLSMYSITENIYYSQPSSVAILLQPETVSYRIIQGNDCVFSPSVLSSLGLPLPPTWLILTVSEARSYFASTVHLLPTQFVLASRRGGERPSFGTIDGKPVAATPPS